MRNFLKCFLKSVCSTCLLHQCVKVRKCDCFGIAFPCFSSLMWLKKFKSQVVEGAENSCQVPRILFSQTETCVCLWMYLSFNLLPIWLFIFKDYWWQFPSRFLYRNVWLLAFAVCCSLWCFFISINVPWVLVKHVCLVIVECSLSLCALDQVYFVASDLRAPLSFDLWDLLDTERS